MKIRNGMATACLAVGLSLLFVLSLAGHAEAQTSVQPVSWWPGDGNADDNIGRNGGELENGAGFAPGKTGAAFSLDGVDDFVQIPNAANLNFDGEQQSFTVEAWIFRRSIGATHVIYDKTTIGATNQIGYRLLIGGDRLIFRTNDPSDPRLNCGEDRGALVTANVWHHVAGVFSAGKSRVYLDGALQATCDFRTDPGSAKFGNTIEPRIGAFTSATGGFFAGLIDDVRIYDRALSDQQIAAIFQGGAEPVGLVSRWQGEGNADDSHGGNKGTLNGAGFAPGKIGTAFSLDGKDDYVEVPDADNLDFAGRDKSFTLAAWVFRKSMGAPHVIYDKTTTGPPFIGYRLAIIGDRVILRTDDQQDRKFNCGENQGAPVTANVWHHVVGVFAAGESRVYLDGVQQTTCNYPGTGKFQNSMRPKIGAFTSATGGFFAGLLDDVRIYGSALSGSEIETLFNEGRAGR